MERIVQNEMNSLLLEVFSSYLAVNGQLVYSSGS